jgi:hypothetical protein
VARNHALFREVNERIYSLSAGFRSRPAEDGLDLSFVCECGSGHCTAEVLIDTDDYSRIRAVPQRYVVLGGHELADVERVVEGAGDYVVVEALEVPVP